MAQKKPYELNIRIYAVGFGDCFLLTFRYQAGGDRHVLIDFGTTAKPKGADKDLMTLIAKDIENVSKGKLHAVVATHRHRDHISGFAANKSGGGTGGTIASCAKSAVILQPWTEHPDAATDSPGPKHFTAGARAFARSLADMQTIAATLLREAERLRATKLDIASRDLSRSDASQMHASRVPAINSDFGESEDSDLLSKGVSRSLIEQLRFVGEDNLVNAQAVKTLMNMGKSQNRKYLYYGANAGLAKVLPGVKTYVLGPPTLRQSQEIEEERRVDEEEYWHLQAMAMRFSAGRAKPLFPKAEQYARGTGPKTSRWFIPRLRGIRAQQLLELVRILDEVLNNTSLILLFEIGSDRILLPGDAQIENWQYALKLAPDHQAVLNRLADVNVYKVGHHGSLNATPKTLWNAFRNKGPAGTSNRLQTIISTRANKHGSTHNETEVPRRPLLEELKKETEFFTSQDLSGKKNDFYRDITIAL